MPSRNIVKTYISGGYYHIYNRGIEKRVIYQDDMDYRTFLKYLSEALLNTEHPSNKLTKMSLQGDTLQKFTRPVKNFYGSISLLSYCLMPNHFHLLLKQAGQMDISKFMQSVITRYSVYFNKKYDRVGKLFQGNYKAALVNDDNYLLHLTRYIHLNPKGYTKNLEQAYSSYKDYIGNRKTLWVNTKEVLDFFEAVSKDFMQGINTYQQFVEDWNQDSKVFLGHAALD